jgi:hypothetical protein
MIGGLNPATGIGGEKMVIKEKNNFFQIFDKTFFPAGACNIKLFYRHNLWIFVIN